MMIGKLPLKLEVKLTTSVFLCHRGHLQTQVYLWGSARSRMPPFDGDISSCGTLTSRACWAKRPFRCNKVSSVGWIGHLPEARALPLPPSLPLSQSEPSSVDPAETGRARRSETVDSGFDEASYQLPAGRCRQGQSSAPFPFWGETEKTQKAPGTESSAWFRPADVGFCSNFLLNIWQRGCFLAAANIFRRDSN